MRSSRSSRGATANGFPARIMRRKRIAGKFPLESPRCGRNTNSVSSPPRRHGPVKTHLKGIWVSISLPRRRIRNDWPVPVPRSPLCAFWGMKVRKLCRWKRRLNRQTAASEEADYSSRLIDGMSAIGRVFRPGGFSVPAGNPYPPRSETLFLRNDDARFFLREAHIAGKLRAQKFNERASPWASVGPQPPEPQKKHQQVEDFRNLQRRRWRI